MHSRIWPYDMLSFAKLQEISIEVKNFNFLSRTKQRKQRKVYCKPKRK